MGLSILGDVGGQRHRRILTRRGDDGLDHGMHHQSAAPGDGWCVIVPYGIEKVLDHGAVRTMIEGHWVGATTIAAVVTQGFVASVSIGDLQAACLQRRRATRGIDLDALGVAGIRRRRGLHRDRDR